MSLRFNLDVMCPGDILPVTGHTLGSRIIINGINVGVPAGQPRCTRSHITGYLGRGDVVVNGRTYRLGSGGFGDAAPWRNRITSLEEYERDMNRGPKDRHRVELEVIRPIYAGGGIERGLPWSPEAGREAADWWLVEVNGRFYDLWEYPGFVLRVLAGKLDINPDKIPGLKNLYTCGTGWNKAWNDICNNLSATPYTFEKRLAEGVFQRVEGAIVDG